MKSGVIKGGIVFSILVNLVFLTSLIICFVLGFNGVHFSIFITLLMFAYHTDIRLIIGGSVNLFKNKINLKSKMFKISEKEYKFLHKLGVKNWKNKIVTWNKKYFSLDNLHDKNNIEFLLKNNITAEIVHFICFFVGFLAIYIGCLLSADEWYIYLITSILASFLIDFPPILIQRYNRYRLLKILK